MNPKTSLEKAVEYLKECGDITKDAEAISRLGVSKGTFSSYKSGATKLSKNFIKKFENEFKIKLSDFEDKPIKKSDSAEPDIKDKYIAQLEKENKRLESELLISLNEIRVNQEAFAHFHRAGLRIAFEVLAGKHKNKTPEELLQMTDNTAFSFQKKPDIVGT